MNENRTLLAALQNYATGRDPDECIEKFLKYPDFIIDQSIPLNLHTCRIITQQQIEFNLNWIEREKNRKRRMLFHEDNYKSKSSKN